MADIQTYLDYILSKVYGKDVRQAIVDAINQCYIDATAGITPVITTEQIAGGTKFIVTVGSVSTSFDIMNGVSPQVAEASTASAMTDTDLIYVYTKDPAESGYITGYWYFYDDYIQNWRSGGQYQSSVPSIDTTLSIAGACADAKKVGDELGNLSSVIGNLNYLETENKTDLVSAINEARMTGGSSEDVQENVYVYPNCTILNDTRVANGNSASVGGYKTYLIPNEEIPAVGIFIDYVTGKDFYFGYYTQSGSSITYTQNQMFPHVVANDSYTGVYLSTNATIEEMRFCTSLAYNTIADKVDRAGFESVSGLVTFRYVTNSQPVFDFDVEDGVYILRSNIGVYSVLDGIDNTSYYSPSTQLKWSEGGYYYQMIPAYNGIAVKFMVGATFYQLFDGELSVYKLTKPSEVVKARKVLPILTMAHQANFLRDYPIAFANGWAGAEVDIRKTSDGEFVLSHDASVGGTSIETTTYENLKSSVPYISTFDEFLNFCVDYDIQPNLHFASLDAWDRMKCIKMARAKGIKPFYYNGISGNIGDLAGSSFYKTGLAVGVGATNYPTNSSEYGDFVYWDTPTAQSDISVMDWMFINDYATSMSYSYLMNTDFSDATWFFGYIKSYACLYK